MTFPTPWTILVHTHSASGRDAYGKPRRSWESDGDPRPVYGWAPPSPDSERSESDRVALVRDLDVYGPMLSIDVDPRDRVSIEGRMYEVVGHAEDFDHGPFGFAPGGRLSLKRVEEVG